MSSWPLALFFSPLPFRNVDAAIFKSQCGQVILDLGRAAVAVFVKLKVAGLGQVKQLFADDCAGELLVRKCLETLLELVREVIGTEITVRSYATF